MKNRIIKNVLILIFLCFAFQSNAIEINPAILNSTWDAQWISHPIGSGLDFEVLHFRKTIDLTEKPESFIIHVSADNRYRLFVNGIPVCFGPARGDISHWYFESIDIAQYLKVGENLLAAVVWNFASNKQIAQKTLRTAFIMQGNSEKEAIVNTNDTWKVIRNAAYKPFPVTDLGGAYYAAGACDKVDGNLYPWNWEMVGYNDTDWEISKFIATGQPFAGVDSSWVLIPRDIPMLEEKEIKFAKVARTENINVNESFLKDSAPQIIPPNTKVSILLDQNELTIAYPQLIVSGGKGSKITITYSEGLFNNGQKLNRNQVGNMKILGYHDYFETDGGDNRMFRPLWYRTYRYVQLDIETSSNSLVLNNFSGVFTAYPFKENASFESNNPMLDKIWDVGWRTVRLCAVETYYDCPYYEQLQYIGDTRIQALISMYVSGDDRLVRKALKLFEWSKIPEGITQSRYPANELQIIPTYSLFWISMMHDYWMLRGDSAFLSTFTNSIQDVLNWYETKIDTQTNMLGYVPYWNFVDWASPWGWNNDLNMGGYPPGMITGGSSILTLQYAYTIDQAVELYRAFGKEDLATYWESKSKILKEATYNLCFKEDKMLMADDLIPTSYSQHASIMGILSGCIPVEKQKVVMKNILENNTLIQVTFYYRFYLNRALKQTGMNDLYISQLNPWEKMIHLGLSTFAEQPEPTRSDCHAWSASPNFEFLESICGIEPASPGFKTIRIKPNLGSLNYIRANMPHPNGEIIVSLDKNADGALVGKITLPIGTNGNYAWKGVDINLMEGENIIKPFPEFKSAQVMDSNKSVILQLTNPISDSIDSAYFQIIINKSSTVQIDKIELNPADNMQLIFHLNQVIEITDSITISYTGTSIESAEGYKLVPFQNMHVDNLLPGSAPELKTARTIEDKKSIMLQFNKALSVSTIEGMKLEIASENFQEIPITGFSLNNEDLSIMTIIFEKPVAGENQLVISYSGTSIKSIDNGSLMPFERKTVINTLSTSSPVIVNATVSNYGSYLELTFNKEMFDAFNSFSNFEIKVNNNPVVISLNSTVGTKIYFYSLFPFRFKDVITISYSGGELRSTDGGLFENITDYPVINPIIQVINKIPGKIEAEKYDTQQGTSMGICTDTGGGFFVSSHASGDWLEYMVNVAEEAYYDVSYRVSSKSKLSEIIFQTKSETFTDLDTITIPDLSATPIWTETKGNVLLNKGQQTIRMYVAKGDIELNWMKFTKTTTAINSIETNNIVFYPNPCIKLVNISLKGNYTFNEIQLFDLSGKLVYTEKIAESTHFQVDCSSFKEGLYLLKVLNNKECFITKISVMP